MRKVHHLCWSIQIGETARPFAMNALSRKQVRQIFDWLKVGGEVERVRLRNIISGTPTLKIA